MFEEMATSAARLLLVVFILILFSLVAYCALYLQDSWFERLHWGDGNASRTSDLGNPEGDGNPFRRRRTTHLPLGENIHFHPCGRKRKLVYEKRAIAREMQASRRINAKKPEHSRFSNILLSQKNCMLCIPNRFLWIQMFIWRYASLLRYVYGLCLGMYQNLK